DFVTYGTVAVIVQSLLILHEEEEESRKKTTKKKKTFQIVIHVDKTPGRHCMYIQLDVVCLAYPKYVCIMQDIFHTYIQHCALLCQLGWLVAEVAVVVVLLHLLQLSFLVVFVRLHVDDSRIPQLLPMS